MSSRHWFSHTLALASSLISLGLLGHLQPVWAGCGCDKLPPELAEVRPNVTYAGAEVTLFHAALESGRPYTVTFTSGTTGQASTVHTQALTRRDLADGQKKPQVVVPVPKLPLGPTSIHLRSAEQDEVLVAVMDHAFTIAPQPLFLPEYVGTHVFPDYQAAVSRDGIVYFSLDVSAIRHPRIFQGQVLGYPLRFTSGDVVFSNTQGFLMQLLEEDEPGLFAVAAASSPKESTHLQYARHEFNTFAFQHTPKQIHALDAYATDWHANGTPHIDHDHIIMAISGLLEDGSFPSPGATPPFDIELHIATFFRPGFFGLNSVALSGHARTDSYSSRTGSVGAAGDVLSNGAIILSDSASINGAATAGSFGLTDSTLSEGTTTDETVSLSDDATITGETRVAQAPTQVLVVNIPPFLENLGSLTIGGTDSLTLGPGSYQVSDIVLEGNGQLFIQNAAGRPVTLYVTGTVQVSEQATISGAHANPEEFAVYIAGNSPVHLSGAAQVSGVLYAPESLIALSGQAEFFGAFVGNAVLVTGEAQIHYDTALRGQ